MLTIIDRADPREEARARLRCCGTRTRAYDFYTRKSTRARGERNGRREGEKERIGVQSAGEKDGEDGGGRGGEDSGGFSRRDGRCADITDK